MNKKVEDSKKNLEWVTNVQKLLDEETKKSFINELNTPIVDSLKGEDFDVDKKWRMKQKAYNKGWKEGIKYYKKKLKKKTLDKVIEKLFNNKFDILDDK